MAKIQIIGGARSPLTRAVRVCALEKGLETEFIIARPHSPEVNAIQPFGKVPVMRHGDLEIAESRAIALYFDGLKPDPPLIPRDLAAAAHAEQWIMHFHTEYVPALMSGYFVHYLFPRGAGGTIDRAAIDAALPSVEKTLAVLDRRLEGRAYLAETFSLADIFFIPVLHYTSMMPEAAPIFAAAPRLADYLARLSARPAFAATLPPPTPLASAPPT